MSKTIVITGASSGVGYETAKRFKKLGWDVIGISRNSPKDEESSKGILWINADIRDFDSVKFAFDQVLQYYGNIDVLVNNASVFKRAPFDKTTSKQIDDIVDTNLKGTLFCTLEGMKLMQGGRIINISSVSGVHGIENQAVYSATKFAVNGFSEALNQETIKHGILVTTISPGGIDTPLWNKSNPYPGKVRDLLRTEDVVSTIEFVVNLPSNVVMKNLTMFPACEWH